MTTIELARSVLTEILESTDTADNVKVQAAKIALQYSAVLDEQDTGLLEEEIKEAKKRLEKTDIKKIMRLRAGGE
jgi:hypothetical protein